MAAALQHQWSFVNVNLKSLANSVWMTRWNVFAGWLFVLLTAAQLIVHILFESQEIHERTFHQTNLVSNVLFFACYSVFVISFFFLEELNGKYSAGIVAFTISYGVFAALSAVSICCLTAANNGALVNSARWLYVSGSIGFAIGSFLLLLGSYPHRRGHLKQQGKPFLLKRFSPVAIHASSFYGSSAFLVGSILFTYDSICLMAEEPSLSSTSLLTAAWCSFEVGRFYFLWASTTHDCDIFFCSKPASAISVTLVPSEDRIFTTASLSEFRLPRRLHSRCHGLSYALYKE